MSELTYDQLNLMLDAFGEITYYKNKWDASLSGGKLKGLPFERKYKPKTPELVLSEEEKKMMDRYFGRS